MGCAPNHASALKLIVVNDSLKYEIRGQMTIHHGNMSIYCMNPCPGSLDMACLQLNDSQRVRSAKRFLYRNCNTFNFFWTINLIHER